MTQPFEQLVVRYQDVVCAVAYATLRDRARSEEIAQEAFLIAWQKLPTLAEPPALPGWLCGIARNLALNAARRRKESAMDREPATETNPLTEVLDRESSTIAEQALASLPERDREVVVLYYRGEGTIEDVAGALGVAPAAVRKRLERARTRLRAAIGSVEASLRSTRPGPAFTAACVAALVSGAMVGHAGAATQAAGSSRYVLPAAVAGVIAALGTVVAIAVASPSAGAADRVRASVEPRSDPATAGGGGHAQSLVRPIDGDTRAALAAQIEASRSARGDSAATALATPIKVYDFAGEPLAGNQDLAGLAGLAGIDGPTGTTPPPAAPPDPTTLSKATLRFAIRSVQPMLLECYQDAADHLARKDGTITVVVRFVTEPGVATIVETARVEGDAHLLDPDLVECMRETLLSIEMPAMTEAAVVDVNYPFTIR